MPHKSETHRRQPRRKRAFFRNKGRGGPFASRDTPLLDTLLSPGMGYSHHVASMVAQMFNLIPWRSQAR